MRLWARSRGFWWYVLITAAVALFAFLREIDIYTPNLRTGQLSSFPLIFAMSIVPSLAWLVLRSRGRSLLDEVALRPKRIAAIDFFGLIIPAIGSGSALLAVSDPVIQGAGRNLLLFSAIALVATAWIPTSFAFALPVTYLLVSALAGFPFAPAGPEWWATVVTPWVPDSEIPMWFALAALGILSLKRRHANRR